LKKVFYILLFAGLSGLKAQNIDVGVGLGLANYWGDLSPAIALGETKASGNVFARLNFNKTWSLTGQLSVLEVSGNDKNFDFNKTRNLNF